MTESAGWFADGPELFAWTHRPVDTSTGTAVVLCPPLGLELITAHRTFRTLATRLAERGVTALRYDYSGTGDSWDDDSSVDAVPGWLRSIDRAVQLVRDAGVERVEIVGMRAGALLAAEAVSRGLEVDELVLWDPHASGRAMLRHERALLRLDLGGVNAPLAGEGAVEGPGFLFSGPTVGSLGAMSIDVTALSARTSVDLLLRAELDPPAEFRELPPAVAVQRVTGQTDLLDVPVQRALVPQTTVDMLVDEVVGRAGARSRPVPAVALRSASTGPNNVSERVVELGPRRLVAIVTEQGTAPGGTVLMTSPSNVHHIGSARTWVSLARLAASRGLRAVRMDQWDVGDSPGALDESGPVFYGGTATEDIVAATRALSDHPEADLAVVGLSAGCWAVCRAAETVRPRGLVLINQWMWKRDVTPQGPTVNPPSDKVTTKIARRLQWSPALLRLATRLNATFRRVNPVIRQRTRSAGDETDLLSPLLDAGTSIDLVFSLKEGQRFDAFHAEEVRKALEVRSQFARYEDPAWDHSLLVRSTRDAVLGLVVDCLVLRLSD